MSCFGFVSAGTLRVTEEHPFLVNGSWEPAKDLNVGDVLQTYDGRQVRIRNITDVVTEKPFFVYNLEDTLGINNYAAGLEGVIVHNSDANSPLRWFSKSIFPPSPKKVMASRISGTDTLETTVKYGFLNRQDRSCFYNGILDTSGKFYQGYDPDIELVYNIPENLIEYAPPGYGSMFGKDYYAISEFADNVNHLPFSTPTQELIGALRDGVLKVIPPEYLDIPKTIEATLKMHRVNGINGLDWIKTADGAKFIKTIDPLGLYRQLYTN